VNFNVVTITEMHPRIPRELVAYTFRSAEHILGTTGLVQWLSTGSPRHKTVLCALARCVPRLWMYI